MAHLALEGGDRRGAALPASRGSRWADASVGAVALVVAVWSAVSCTGNGPESRLRDVRRLVVDSDLFAHLQEYQEASDFLLNVAEVAQVLSDLHGALRIAEKLPYGKELVEEIGILILLGEVEKAIAEIDVVQTVRRTVTGLAEYHPALRRAFDDAVGAPGKETLLALADAAERGVRLLAPVQVVLGALALGTDAAAAALAKGRQWVERCAKGGGLGSFACDLAEPALAKLHRVAEGGLAAWVGEKRRQIDSDVSVLSQIGARCRE